MMSYEKPFLALTAEDLMSHEVLTIPQDTPLREAAHLLTRSQISGAPVVDAAGRCIGVLSKTDFLQWADKAGQPRAIRCSVHPCVCSEWQVVDLELLPGDEVRWHMTADPVLVRPLTPVAELARMMLDTHIHRVIVTDEGRRPIGIVTATDILAAVVHMADRFFAGRVLP